jgi:VWFA-related protein
MIIFIDVPGGGMITALRRKWCVGYVALAAGLCGASLAQVEKPEPPPLDVGLEEEVEVQLVLVDFLVLDRKDRTVPDLTKDDFVLVVSGRESDIHSLDVDCPVGEADEPLPGTASRKLSDSPTVRPRRLVIVFDYFHMSNAAETFDSVHEMLDKWPVGGEEHMVVSLGNVVRIESPFTTDMDELRWTLRRMRNDPDLYAGSHGRLTERGFFDRVEVLFDLLERWEGRKTVVMFSGPFLRDGFFRDPEFKRLSALSTATRTAVYPVDTGGIRTGIDPRDSGLLGPPMLRRLANETGGRMTSNTNEIGLAYAKAHRDLGCTYTLGFYNRRSRPDQKRRLTIRVKDRRDVRVVYPEFYTVRSEEEKRKSLFRTAAMTPQMFESEEIRADLFLLAPHSPSRWRALLAVEVRLGSDAFIEEDEEWELKGLVRKPNGTIVRSFKKTVPMPPTDPVTGKTPVVTVFQEIRARPGRYIVSAVLSDPRADRPLAATRPAVIAEIPRGEPFLVGPVLGRRSATGDENGFEPLLVPEAERGEALDSLTVVCAVGAENPVNIHHVGRRRRAAVRPGLDPAVGRRPGQLSPTRRPRGDGRARAGPLRAERGGRNLGPRHGPRHGRAHGPAVVHGVSE